MTDTIVKTSEPAQTEAAIARRLQETLRVVREDEIRFKQVLEVRRLKRRARKGLQVK